MSNNDMNKTVRQFYKAVEGVKSKKSGGYDTQATVRRIEDGVAWVHIPDGVDETPARLTISAKEGDVVQVRIVNGRAFLVGNASAPPTDNTEAVKAMGQAGLAAEAASIARQKADEAVADAATAHEAAAQAQDSADIAQAAAESAQRDADDVADNLKSVVAGATTVEKAVSVMQTALEAVVDYDPTTDTTKEFFWHDANGAHVLGADSGFRNDIDSSGMKVVDVATEHEVASFGTETSIKTVDGTELAHFGYDEGQAETGTAVAPYSVFGRLLSADSSLYLDDYYQTMTYAVGDFVRYNDTMYVCTTHTPDPAGTWNSAYWQEATSGNYSFATGDSCYAFGWASTAEGSGRACGNDSHAEGDMTNAIGAGAHAEGSRTHAKGTSSHAEGDVTLAYGDESHAEGYSTTAFGDQSHAEGYEAVASGDASHAQNIGTYAGYEAQTAIGKYNSNSSTHVFEIGNGTSDSARSNAMSVDWNGNVRSNNLSLKQLTMTRTSNSLVDATSFARMTAYTRSDILFLNGNLYITFSGNVGFTEIGRITGWSAAYAVLIDVPLQDNGAKVALIQIDATGIISVYTNTGAASGFFRFNISVPCA